MMHYLAQAIGRQMHYRRNFLGEKFILLSVLLLSSEGIAGGFYSIIKKAKILSWVNIVTGRVQCW